MPIPSAFVLLWPFVPSSHTEIKGLHMYTYCTFMSHGYPTHCRHGWEGSKDLAALQRVERHSPGAVSTLVEKGLQVLYWWIYCTTSPSKGYYYCDTRQTWRRRGAWLHLPSWDMVFGCWCHSRMGASTATQVCCYMCRAWCVTVHLYGKVEGM